jgi:hypothetical protein
MTLIRMLIALVCEELELRRTRARYARYTRSRRHG